MNSWKQNKMKMQTMTTKPRVWTKVLLITMLKPNYKGQDLWKQEIKKQDNQNL